jgi:hypothetical protein
MKSDAIDVTTRCTATTADLARRLGISEATLKMMQARADWDRSLSYRPGLGVLWDEFGVIAWLRRRPLQRIGQPPKYLMTVFGTVDRNVIAGIQAAEQRFPRDRAA